MNTELAECANCLCLPSRRAARTVTRVFDRKMRPFGIRATQFSALVMLSPRGVLTIGELAQSLGLERTTLTRNLELIEAKGWLKIKVGDDALSRVVSVTPKGRAAVTAAFGAWHEAQGAALSEIGSSGAKAIRVAARCSASPRHPARRSSSCKSA
jgi:DNA-binding MarR family transcriptional regulator